MLEVFAQKKARSKVDQEGLIQRNEELRRAQRCQQAEWGINGWTSQSGSTDDAGDRTEPK